jgi:hypothetical protein
MAGACHRLCDFSNDAMDRCLAVALITDDIYYGIMILLIEALNAFTGSQARPALSFMIQSSLVN